MKTLAILGFLAFALSGCAADIYARNCANYGIVKGDQNWSQCMMHERDVDVAQANSIIGALAVAYSISASQPAFYQPSHPTTCMRLGPNFATCQ